MARAKCSVPDSSLWEPGSPHQAAASGSDAPRAHFAQTSLLPAPEGHSDEVKAFITEWLQIRGLHLEGADLARSLAEAVKVADRIGRQQRAEGGRLAPHSVWNPAQREGGAASDDDGEHWSVSKEAPAKAKEDAEEDGKAQKPAGLKGWGALQKRFQTTVALKALGHKDEEKEDGLRCFDVFHDARQITDKLMKTVDNFERTTTSRRYKNVSEALSARAGAHASMAPVEALLQHMSGEDHDETHSTLVTMLREAATHQLEFQALDEQENEISKDAAWADERKEVHDRLHEDRERLMTKYDGTMTEAVTKFHTASLVLQLRIHDCRKEREALRRRIQEYEAEWADLARRHKQIDAMVAEIEEKHENLERERRKRLENLKGSLVLLGRSQESLDKAIEDTKVKCSEVWSRIWSRVDRRMMVNSKNMLELHKRRRKRNHDFKHRAQQLRKEALQRETRILESKLKQRQEDVKAAVVVKDLLMLRAYLLEAKGLRIELGLRTGEVGEDGSVTSMGLGPMVNGVATPLGLLSMIKGELQVQQAWLASRGQPLDFSRSTLALVAAPNLRTPLFLQRNVRKQIRQFEMQEKIAKDIMSVIESRNTMKVVTAKNFLLQFQRLRTERKHREEHASEQPTEPDGVNIPRQCAVAVDQVLVQNLLAVPSVEVFDMNEEEEEAKPSLEVLLSLGPIGKVAQELIERFERWKADHTSLFLPQLGQLIIVYGRLLDDLQVGCDLVESCTYWFTEGAESVDAFNGLLGKELKWLPRLGERLSRRCGLLRAVMQHLELAAAEGKLEDTLEAVCSNIALTEPIVSDQEQGAAEAWMRRLQQGLNSRLGLRTASCSGLRWYCGAHREEGAELGALARGMEAIGHILTAPQLQQVDAWKRGMASELNGLVSLAVDKVLKEYDPEARDAAFLALSVLDRLVQDKRGEPAPAPEEPEEPEEPDVRPSSMTESDDSRYSWMDALRSTASEGPLADSQADGGESWSKLRSATSERMSSAGSRMDFLEQLREESESSGAVPAEPPGLGEAPSGVDLPLEGQSSGSPKLSEEATSPPASPVLPDGHPVIEVLEPEEQREQDMDRQLSYQAPSEVPSYPLLSPYSNEPSAAPSPVGTPSLGRSGEVLLPSSDVGDSSASASSGTDGLLEPLDIQREGSRKPSVHLAVAASPSRSPSLSPSPANLHYRKTPSKADLDLDDIGVPSDDEGDLMGSLASTPIEDVPPQELAGAVVRSILIKLAMASGKPVEAPPAVTVIKSGPVLVAKKPQTVGFGEQVPPSRMASQQSQPPSRAVSYASQGSAPRRGSLLKAPGKLRGMMNKDDLSDLSMGNSRSEAMSRRSSRLQSGRRGSPEASKEPPSLEIAIVKAVSRKPTERPAERRSAERATEPPAEPPAEEPPADPEPSPSPDLPQAQAQGAGAEPLRPPREASEALKHHWAELQWMRKGEEVQQAADDKASALASERGPSATGSSCSMEVHAQTVNDTLPIEEALVQATASNRMESRTSLDRVSVHSIQSPAAPAATPDPKIGSIKDDSSDDERPPQKSATGLTETLPVTESSLAAMAMAKGWSEPERPERVVFDNILEAMATPMPWAPTAATLLAPARLDEEDDEDEDWDLTGSRHRLALSGSPLRETPEQKAARASALNTFLHESPSRFTPQAFFPRELGELRLRREPDPELRRVQQPHEGKALSLLPLAEVRAMAESEEANYAQQAPRPHSSLNADVAMTTLMQDAALSWEEQEQPDWLKGLRKGSYWGALSEEGGLPLPSLQPAAQGGGGSACGSRQQSRSTRMSSHTGERPGTVASTAVSWMPSYAQPTRPSTSAAAVPASAREPRLPPCSEGDDRPGASSPRVLPTPHTPLGWVSGSPGRRVQCMRIDNEEGVVAGSLHHVGPEGAGMVLRAWPSPPATKKEIEQAQKIPRLPEKKLHKTDLPAVHRGTYEHRLEKRRMLPVRMGPRLN